MSITRISISLEENIGEQFDALIERQGFPTRSEAVKHLIKQALVNEEWKSGGEVAGVITLIYDHHKPQILQQITETQHEFGEAVVCSQHAHLDHHNCMENIIVRGNVADIQKLHKGLAAVKGMKHAVLSMSTTGKNVN
ncbi:MAG: nickel-responsive transcriptional regulator NikR [Planctomycetaceae bacterium]|jgi:CopG family nickel-responsive transcriptional regulator|nr:nickel-responsive transcriptional regulator NikR [Planctomycetaceae bacterium]